MFAGTTAWAGPFDAARAELPIAAPPGAWLTVFQDTKSPRPGKDEVYFDPAQDQTPIRPPDIDRGEDIPPDGADIVGLASRGAAEPPAGEPPIAPEPAGELAAAVPYPNPGVYPPGVYP